MKKVKQKYIDILRWVILVPAVYTTWFVVVMGFAFVFRRVPILWNSDLIVIDLFVCPSIAMFFVAKYIAPKYKNIVGWVAVALCALFVFWFVSSLVYSY
jgi:hypothetical protein